MTAEQTLISIVLVLVLGLFAWGKWRHDMVAAFALVTCVVLGLIPADSAFVGFGHPAVITVALVLIVSHGLKNSGVVDMAVRHLGPLTRHPVIHIGALTLIVTVASAFMNNVGALALLLPVALATAKEHSRSPALLLMPLAFGSILGGMTTMIGTPSNIIVATYLAGSNGNNFGMFDFAPVGVPVAIVGFLFVVLFGWRLLPRERLQHVPTEQLFAVGEYLTELKVPEDSPIIGERADDIELLNDGDIELTALAHARSRAHAVAGTHVFRAKDVLVVQADTEKLKPLIEAYQLEVLTTATAAFEAGTSGDELILREGIVVRASQIAGRDVNYLRARTGGTVALVGVARQGKTLKNRLRRTKFLVGDVLLLQGDVENLEQQLLNLRLLPLASRELGIVKPQRTLLAMGIFALAITAGVLNLMPLTIAFLIAIFAYVLLGILSASDLYSEIDWPVIVLLGAMIPVGHALETTGMTSLIAESITSMTTGMSVALILGLVLVTTMLMSDIINNAATVLVMAPIAVSISSQINSAVEPFLMAVAVGASCAFLTPIGHQSNTLVMGPGGYHFGDYWRMGLPLEILIAIISIPAILFFWPPF